MTAQPQRTAQPSVTAQPQTRKGRPTQPGIAPSAASPNPFQPFDAVLFALLAAFIFWTRFHFRGAVYFVDGPLLVRAIRIRQFVIQSPGYWLFAHLGGLFRNPASGLAFWNWLFSALGVAIFFPLCRSFGLRRALSMLAALTYGSIYFVWFAGEIHSAYAAEILFPPLTLLCFRMLQTAPATTRASAAWTAAAALSASAAIALRPSDGVFLLPLWAYLLFPWRRNPRILLTFAAVLLVTSLAWYIPSHHALQLAGFPSSGPQLMFFLRITSILFAGITPRSMANITRVVIPLFTAFWALLPAMFARRPHRLNGMLLWWAAPGLLFFLLLYMADPTYVVYLSGSFILAAALCPHRRLARACLALCLACNSTLFLLAAPLAGNRPSAPVWNFYIAKYCHSGIAHRWSTTLGQAINPSTLPGRP